MGGGGGPSRLGWDHGVSAGGLMAASCQKQAGEEGVFY